MKVKLIKIMAKFDTPLKETILALFPRENEKTLKENYILVSNDKYNLLKFNHVDMYVYDEIDIANIHKIIEGFDYKEYHIVKEVVKLPCVEEDIVKDIKERIAEIKKTNKKKYKEGDSVLYFIADDKKPYIDALVEPIPEVAPLTKGSKTSWYKTKINEDGNWEADEKKKADKAFEVCEEIYHDYLIKKLEYDKKKAKLESDKYIIHKYHILATLIVDDEKCDKLYITKGYKFLLESDFTFETSKDSDQFCIVGKFDKTIPTKVSAAIGGLKTDESLKGKSYTEVITKLFGLEPEVNKVGTVQTVE